MTAAYKPYWEYAFTQQSGAEGGGEQTLGATSSWSYINLNNEQQQQPPQASANVLFQKPNVSSVIEKSLAPEDSPWAATTVAQNTPAPAPVVQDVFSSWNLPHHSGSEQQTNFSNPPSPWAAEEATFYKPPQQSVSVQAPISNGPQDSVAIGEVFAPSPYLHSASEQATVYKPPQQPVTEHVPTSNGPQHSFFTEEALNSSNPHQYSVAEQAAVSKPPQHSVTEPVTVSKQPQQPVSEHVPTSNGPQHSFFNVETFSPRPYQHSVTGQTTVSNPLQHSGSEQTNLTNPPSQSVIEEAFVSNAPQQSVTEQATISNGPQQSAVTDQHEHSVTKEAIISKPPQHSVTEQPISNDPQHVTEQATVPNPPSDSHAEQTFSNPTRGSVSGENSVSIPAQHSVTEEVVLSNPQSVTTEAATVSKPPQQSVTEQATFSQPPQYSVTEQVAVSKPPQHSVTEEATVSKPPQQPVVVETTVSKPPQQSVMEQATFSEPARHSVTEKATFSKPPQHSVTEQPPVVLNARAQRDVRVSHDHARTRRQDEPRPTEMINKSNIRDRYRRVRKQYPEVLHRLERQRATTPAKLEWHTPPHVERRLTLSMATTPPESAQSSALNSPSTRPDKKHNNSTPKESNSQASADTPELSSIALPAAPPLVLDNSIIQVRMMRTTSTDSNGNVDQRVRPPSRTESDFGENYGDRRRRRGQHDRYYYEEHSRRRRTGGRYTPMDDHRAYVDDYYDPRPRPRSAALPAMQRYFSYEHRDDRESDESVSDESYESFGPADINDGYRDAARQRAMREQSLYYFGVIGLPGGYVNARPPHPEYLNLEPIERVAYIYHYSLYRRYISDVREFQRMFRYQHVRLVYERQLNDEDALREIVRQIRADFQRVRDQQTAANQARQAYEASQRQLFSDERETPELAERNPKSDDLISFADHSTHQTDENEKESDRSFEMSDQTSVESGQREPPKHRAPHALARFGASGRLLTVMSLPDGKASSVLEIRGVKELITDESLLEQLELIESFRGPLVPGQTATHSVLLYIRRTMQQMQTAEEDCLLIWRLLQIVVQQQGRVSGPDLALLLLDGYDHSKCTYSSPSSLGSGSQKALVDFRALLLGGHVREALDLAQRQHLWSEALFLAHKLGDSRVFDKFVSFYSSADPLRTLYEVLSGGTPSVSVGRSDNADYSWRAHAAVLLANGAQTQQALTSIYQLGLSLAAEGRCFGSDFCLLTVHLLAGWNVFMPMQGPDGNPLPYISLLHATPESVQDKDRMEILNLHATEIYDFSVSLHNAQMALPSLELQQRKFSYVQRLVELGMGEEAFRYCEMIAAKIQTVQAPETLVNPLKDLADSLRSFALSEQDLAWINGLTLTERTQNQAQIPSQDSYFTADQSQVVQQAVNREPVYNYSEPQFVQNRGVSEPPMPATTEIEPRLQERDRVQSLSEESDAWHGEMTEPIEMVAHHYPTPPPPPSSSGQRTVDDDLGTESVQSSALSTPVHRQQLQATMPYHTPATHMSLSPNDSVFEHDSPYDRPLDTTPKPPELSAPPVVPPFMAPPPGPQFDIGPPPEMPPILQPPPKEQMQSPMNLPPAPQAQSTPGQDKPAPATTPNANANASKGSSNSFMRWIASKVAKGPNQMILPDDKKKSIVWNEATGKWEGAGVEEEKVEGPPPTHASDQQLETRGLKATRQSGGSRYFNAMAASDAPADSPQPVQSAPAIAPPQPPVMYGFMPIVQNGLDGPEDFNPFSVGDPSVSRSRQASESSSAR